MKNNRLSKDGFPEKLSKLTPGKIECLIAGISKKKQHLPYYPDPEHLRQINGHLRRCIRF